MLNLVQLAAQNALRRRLRTGVTVLGVAIAVAALFSLLSFQRGYQAGMQSELDRLGAHVLVVPKGCPYDAASMALHGASWPCYLKESYITQVRATDGVASASPLLMNALYDASGGQSVYMGAEPDLLSVKRNWHITGSFPKKGIDCLVGASIAQQQHLRVGQMFALPGMQDQKPLDRTGRVAGILQPTQGADDTFIYMPLVTVQHLFQRPHEVTHILVRLSDPNQLDKVVGGLRGCEAGMDMNIVPLTHLFRSIQGLVSSTRTLLLCVLVVALLVAGAGVSNTILMAVSERTREIGLMRAVGASRSDVFRLIWLEAMQVCLTGGVVGVLLAVMGAGSVENWLRERLPFSPTTNLLHPELGVILLCLGGAVLLGSLSGLLPAWRAARLSPMESIRTGGGM